MASAVDNKIIMAWSKCTIEVGDTPDDDSIATDLTDLGYVKDRSTTLTSEEGETLEMKASGGETVGYEKQEGSFVLTTRIIEPTDAIYTMFGLGSVDSSDSSMFNVKTHICPNTMTIKVTPKNLGAKGIIAPKCSISVSPGWSEEDGNYLDLTAGVLHGAQDYWYKRFTTK